MKRSGPWLRWLGLGLGLCVEASLRLYSASRICFDVPGNLDRSHPILLVSRMNPGVVLIENGTKVQLLYDFDDYGRESKAISELEKLVSKNIPARGARRTREGQLLDNNGRILLDFIEEGAPFAYSSKFDLLVWKSSHSKQLTIRRGDRSTTVETWGIHDVQIRSDGTIWLAEGQLLCGIAALDAEGNFLGWRAFGHNERFVRRFCEVSDADRPRFERLKALLIPPSRERSPKL
jgi:hypothetical protein